MSILLLIQLTLVLSHLAARGKGQAHNSNTLALSLSASPPPCDLGEELMHCGGTGLVLEMGPVKLREH